MCRRCRRRASSLHHWRASSLHVCTYIISRCIAPRPACLEPRRGESQGRAGRRPRRGETRGACLKTPRAAATCLTRPASPKPRRGSGLARSASTVASPLSSPVGAGVSPVWSGMSLTCVESRQGDRRCPDETEECNGLVGASARNVTVSSGHRRGM